MAEISIIVPVYNCEKYIEKCINSILRQTFSDFELILVDDGSNDSSAKICDDFSQQDSRIIVIHKKNGGAASARNCGLDAACGRFVAFVDGDDMIHPKMMEILHTLIERTGVDISACHYQFVAPNETVQMPCYGEEIYKQVSIEQCKELISHFDQHCRRVSLISPCMRLCKKEVFDSLRFQEGFIEEDSMILPYILERANQIAKVKIPLYYWTENPNSVTRVSFNPKRFAFVKVSSERVRFFESRHNEQQARIFRREYLNRIVAFYIKAKESGMEEEFIPYLMEYRKIMPGYITKSGLSIREKGMHLSFWLGIPLYQNLYNQLKPVEDVFLR